MKGRNPRIAASPIPRTLRQAPTDAERLLWRHLRARQLGGHKFRRQHPFLDYVLDFPCLEARLAVELDGGQHLDCAADRRRDARLEAAGWRVLRFWNHQLLTETPGVLEVIRRVLEERCAVADRCPGRVGCSASIQAGDGE